MSDLLFDHEASLRNVAFFGGIIVFALWEVLGPRRGLGHSVPVRWSGNLGIAALNIVLFRLALPLGLIAVALFATDRGWGLLNQAGAPAWLALLLGVVVLDLVKYFEHRALHGVPLLWRLHVVHHADLDIDFTTAFRHHPFELVVGVTLSTAVIVLVGVPAEAVLVFELLATVVATYSHMNARTPGAIEGALRAVIVTPEMHGVHHSALRRETDSNFGLILSFWDRLFGTYVARPAAGLDDLTVGVEYFRESGDLRLDRLLLMPFRRPERPRIAPPGSSTAPAQPS